MMFRNALASQVPYQNISNASNPPPPVDELPPPQQPRYVTDIYLEGNESTSKLEVQRPPYKTTIMI